MVQAGEANATRSADGEPVAVAHTAGRRSQPAQAGCIPA